ncbi:BQ5605_C009g05616 [Microbotryum silenes-dioicae]|uniref:BQ5605_C009g05616 protein n=1 Tax=Microbotryum silenes-dioicae TaxID=796604 RepID=A0A2X0N0L2_9BASI|nr:BQ5605_C009g05616 [Microbotryum silenes-dioicae]
MSAPTSTTITILPARLLLVRLPREQLQSLMAPILDCWWFRGEQDPFFSLCSNEVEVSLFASTSAVRSSFGAYIQEPSRHPPFHGRFSSGDSDLDEVDDDPADDDGHDGSRRPDDDPDDVNESGITLGTGARTEDHASKSCKRRSFDEFDDTGQRHDESQRKQDEKVQVGADVWVVLECAFHGDGWEQAGRRIRDLSSPLADAGVSILFLSTYNSDFLLVMEDSLAAVTSILEESGFQFTANDDDDDDEELDHTMAASTTDLRRGGSFRRSRARAASSSTHGSGSARMSGSLSGSLVMSDQGSSHAGSVSRAPNGSATMSRSGSLGKRATGVAAALQKVSMSPARSIGEASSPLLQTNLPLNDSPGAMSPGGVARSITTADFVSSNSLTILPDELVCIGLSQQHETFWRSKIVECLFFPERVLPAPRASSSGRRPPVSVSPTRSRISTVLEDSKSSTREASPYTKPPLSRRPSNRATSHIISGGARGSSANPLLSPAISSHTHPLAASFLSTLDADYPTPFIALTQTLEGVSLMADVRLLRKVFKEGEDEGICFIVGPGGLHSIWNGEDGVGSDDESSDDECGFSPRRGRERTRSNEHDRVQMETALEEELHSGTESSESRSRTREQEAREAERRDRKFQAKDAGKLLKCLQLDLSSFGLGKWYKRKKYFLNHLRWLTLMLRCMKTDTHGIVEHFAGLLVNGGLNCLYQSTFSTANILVAKDDIVRARRILEEHI